MKFTYRRDDPLAKKQRRVRRWALRPFGYVEVNEFRIGSYNVTIYKKVLK